MRPSMSSGGLLWRSVMMVDGVGDLDARLGASCRVRLPSCIVVLRCGRPLAVAALLSIFLTQFWPLVLQSGQDISGNKG